MLEPARGRAAPSLAPGAGEYGDLGETTPCFRTTGVGRGVDLSARALYSGTVVRSSVSDRVSGHASGRPSNWAEAPLRSVLVGLMLVSGCFDDPPMVGETEQAGSTSANTVTTTSPTNPTSTGPVSTGNQDTTEGDDTTTGGSTEGTSTGPSSECGDDQIEGDEQCDGAELGGEDCISQGFGEGRLSCADDCTFDTDGCVTFRCGNDQIEGMEACDGAELGGEDCISQGFDMGELACDDDCQSFDASGCIAFSCGNELIEGVEVCDGANLGGEDCISQGLVGGTLACLPGCANFDISGCITCGNDSIEPGEVCDGIDFGGASCVSEGLGGGTVTCAADCGSIGTAGCGTISNCCMDNGSPSCDNAACSNVICMADAFCCNNEWDGVCATAAEVECGVCLGMACPHLLCDTGIPLMPACDSCVDLVCTADPTCCSDTWHAGCVALVQSECSVSACP